MSIKNIGSQFYNVIFANHRIVCCFINGYYHITYRQNIDKYYIVKRTSYNYAVMNNEKLAIIHVVSDQYILINNIIIDYTANDIYWMQYDKYFNTVFYKNGTPIILLGQKNVDMKLSEDSVATICYNVINEKKITVVNFDKPGYRIHWGLFGKSCSMTDMPIIVDYARSNQINLSIILSPIPHVYIVNHHYIDWILKRVRFGQRMDKNLCSLVRDKIIKYVYTYSIAEIPYVSHILV